MFLGILGSAEKRSNWKTEHRVSNFKWLWSHLSSLELLASKAHVSSSPYVLFLEGFRHINLSPFRHISGTVRHYVLMVVFEFSCQNNGVSRRGWNGVKHQERPPGGLKSIRAYQNTDYKKKKNTSPAQAGLHSPYSHVCWVMHVNISEVVKYNQWPKYSFSGFIRAVVK